MTPQAIAALALASLGIAAVVGILALCRMSGRSDRIASEAWEREQARIEMETDYYEEHG